jgi:hypothetical protein
MAYKHFAGAERVVVWTARRRVGDPLPGGGLYELAEHSHKRSSARDRGDVGGGPRGAIRA